ncbi:MAG: PaaX family transcriptional regulator [Proteobacteria bacterium]|nr:PaaX family transcriptional regulator [Pseudomonadota bacterium]
MRSSRRLIVELLSAIPMRATPVQELIRAAAILDISANNLRVLLARLKRDGLIETTRRGHYRLGPEARAVQQQVGTWREVEDQIRPWSGDWVAVHTGALGRSDRRATRARDRALRLLGFRQLRNGLHVRPDNLLGSVSGIRDRLNKLGMERQALVCRLSCLDPTTESQALALWDGDRLNASYADMRSMLVAAAQRIAKLSSESAAREAFLIGSEALRQIVLDPLLPEPIVDGARRARFFAEMRKFDALGRSYWESIMRPPLRTVSSQKEVANV